MLVLYYVLERKAMYEKNIVPVLFKQFAGCIKS